MNFQKYFLLVSFLCFSLGACRKRLITYTIKVSADDANTTRVWKGEYKSGDELANVNINNSSEPNQNDAVVKSVVIKYDDARGKQVEIKDFGEPTANADLEEETNLVSIGSSYSKNFQIPAGTTFTVLAKANQTGFVRLRKAGSSYYFVSKGDKLSHARVTLRIEVLRDGEQIAYKQVSKEDRAELSLEVKKGKKDKKDKELTN